jgi:hypothetical protein
MKSTLRRYRLTLSALLLATAATVTMEALNLNLINIELRFLAGFGHDRVDDFAVIWGAAGIACAVDQRRRHQAQLDDGRRRSIEAEERLRMVQSTMKAAQGIVAASLNGLQLLRVQAGALVSDDARAALDGSIRATMSRLREQCNAQPLLGLYIPNQPPEPGSRAH